MGFNFLQITNRYIDRSAQVDFVVLGVSFGSSYRKAR